MATLMATEIYSKHSHVKLALITYGQPRVLAKESAEISQEFPFFYARCVNHGDIVPKVPPSFLGFKHFGQPIYYKVDPIGEWDLHIDNDFDGEGLWSGVDLINHLVDGETGYLNRIKEGLMRRASKYRIHVNTGHDHHADEGDSSADIAHAHHHLSVVQESISSSVDEPVEHHHHHHY
jgi:hypothetical protein